MNTTTIKNYAKRARLEFQKIVAERAKALGVSAKGAVAGTPAGDMIVINGRPFPKSIEPRRRALADLVTQKGFDNVVEQIAYTLFNRFCALRFMEVHGYIPYRVFTSGSGDETPDILKHAIEAAEALISDPDKQAEIKDLKLRGDQDQQLYSALILAQCNALAKAMPFLFEKPNDVTELLMPENLLHSDSVVRDLVDSIDEPDWQEIEIVGWLYQFYISDKKDEVIGKVVKKEDIPAATQLFTPRWIVQYMVENSLGRLWLQSHPESKLKAHMPYYIENPDDAKLSPDEILKVGTPDEIKCMDPCCGSGHILVYMFDLLYAMYEETGYIQRDIPKLILESNLHGLDIDERAAQLSGFALMMKARDKDPRFLEDSVQPNVIAIEESNGIDLQAEARIEGKAQRSPFESDTTLIPDEGLLPARKAGGRGDDPLTPFAPLVRFFEDAQNYGSLLRVPESLAAKLDDLESQLGKLRGGSALFGGVALPRLERLVQQAKMLAGKYHVAATNPPYMGGKGMNADMKEFAKDQYPDSKADLFAMFIERDLDYAMSNGLSAMITMQSWMFLSSYESLRERLLSEACLNTMAHLGPRGFDSIGGEVVQTTAFVLANAQRPESKGVYLRLVDGGSEAEKSAANLEAIRNPDCGWFFRASSADFKKIPGSPIAYWVSDNVRSLFDHEKISEVADTRLGMATANNDLFIRLWHEVEMSEACLHADSRSAAEFSGKKWFPYQKGGEFRKWYGNLDYLVDWKNDGRAIRGYSDPATGKVRSHNYNLDFIFRDGVTWNALTSYKTSARLSRFSLFDNAGSSLFSDSQRLHKIILAYLNSNLLVDLISLISPTLNYQPGDIGKLPANFEIRGKAEIEHNTDILIEKARHDWDSLETAWDFAEMPLLTTQNKGLTIEASYASACHAWLQAAAEVRRLEEENNRIFIDAYGLQDELTPEVPLEEITLTCNPVYRYGAGKTEAEHERLQREDTMKELISYAVGCMMGRYSPDTPGLQFAGGTYDHAKACKAAPSFHPDEDGILPLLADSYFEDDVTARFAEFLKATFGTEHLSENLRFVAEAIGIKGSESPQDAIRRFLATDFFKYHMRMYKKRPIYWLFSSGKEKAFQALVYLHRYTPSTLARMRTGYLHELQNKMRARVDDLEQSKDAASSTAQANRIGKEIAKLRKQLEELRVYDEKLHHYADQRIKIDLDDGVKHNYGLFGDLLAEVKAITGDKE